MNEGRIYQTIRQFETSLLFPTSLTIPPSLSVTVEDTRAIYFHISVGVLAAHMKLGGLYLLPTPNPEGDTFLKVIVEIVRLPILDVVCELTRERRCQWRNLPYLP